MNKVKIKTAFTEMFSIKYPIVAAPMFLVSDAGLTIAACKAGGMGSFPALNYRPIENFEKAVVDVKSQTDQAFAVNLIVNKTNKHQFGQLDICLKHEVPLLITSLGGPKSTIKAAQGTGTKVFCNMANIEHAKKVIDLGADGLIFAGSGAGGHGGELSIMAMLPLLRSLTDIPIIAAGCISGGRGMLAALSLGASAVYMGTRMIATNEAKVPQAYKEAIVKAKGEDIITTDKVDGFPGNFINSPELEKVSQGNIVEDVLSRNQKVKRWISLFRAGKALFPKEGKGAKLSYKTVFSAGQGVANIDSILSVEEVIERTVREYEKFKGELP